MKIKIELEDAQPNAANPRGSGARDLRLFRNGSLVRSWRGDVLNGQTYAALEADVPIIAGENRFVAYAFNRDNVKSRDASLAVQVAFARSIELLSSKAAAEEAAPGARQLLRDSLNAK